MIYMRGQWVSKRGKLGRFSCYMGGLCLILLSLNGCVNDSMSDTLMKVTPERLARQSMQTRTFDVTDNANLMRAIMNVVQDQHYTIRETNDGMGMLYADQTYDIGTPISLFGIPLARVHQRPGMPNMNINIGPLSFGGGRDGVYLAKKISSISVISMPGEDKKGYRVHVSVEVRTFYNTGQIGQIWLITDSKLYQNFFNALSKAVYLQGQQS